MSRLTTLVIRRNTLTDKDRPSDWFMLVLDYPHEPCSASISFHWMMKAKKENGTEHLRLGKTHTALRKRVWEKL